MKLWYLSLPPATVTVKNCKRSQALVVQCRQQLVTVALDWQMSRIRSATAELTYCVSVATQTLLQRSTQR